MHLLAELDHLVLQRPLAQHAVDHQPQVVGVHRLVEEVVGAHAHGQHRLVDAAEGAHDNYGNGELPFLDALEQAHAVEVRHLQIGEQDAVAVLRQRVEGGPAVADGVHREMAVRREESAQLLAGELGVLRDQNAPFHSVTGDGMY